MTLHKNTVQRGDWVKFQRGYGLVIGEVQYVRERIGLCVELVTDIGSVPIDQILEIRHVSSGTIP